MEGDPLARITPWRSEGEGESQDGTPVHNSNPAINMPDTGADTSAGAAGKEPSQASADWGDMGEFSMGPLEAPAFSGAEDNQHPEQRQQHSHTTRYERASRACLPMTCWKAKSILHMHLGLGNLTLVLHTSLHDICKTIAAEEDMGFDLVIEADGDVSSPWNSLYMHDVFSGAAGRRRGDTGDSTIKGAREAQKSCRITLITAGMGHLQSDRETGGSKLNVYKIFGVHQRPTASHPYLCLFHRPRIVCTARDSLRWA